VQIVIYDIKTLVFYVLITVVIEFFFIYLISFKLSSLYTSQGVQINCKCFTLSQCDCLTNTLFVTSHIRMYNHIITFNSYFFNLFLKTLVNDQKTLGGKILNCLKISFPPILFLHCAMKAGLQIHNNCHIRKVPVYSGSRRSFFCRMKTCKISIKDEHGCLPSSNEKGMVILKC
jgi:hypothetical protein